MKIKQILITLALLFATLALAACGGTTPDDGAANDQALQEDQINQINTQVAETLRAEMQMTIEAQPTATSTSIASPTPQTLATNTPLPSLESPTPFPTLPALSSPTPIPTKPPTTGGRPCYRAELLWEQPKDGYVLKPGEDIIKQWNFANSGECTWTENFNLILVDGANMAENASYNLVDISNMTADGIPNGGKLEIELRIIAPESPGKYRGVYLLRSDNNETFGIGALGDEIFWVEIIVRE
ncbi:MAG TPA: NBR1-Ig-like domain-containing protein [Anaerolineales bacterium]|nr:NBR1-Ig-like domain-containing protein [Anaerolineales bacterium]